MKQNMLKTMGVVAALVAASCATQTTTSWEFRYEDHDRIAGVATRIDTAAADLQELAARSEGYTTSLSLNAGTHDWEMADSTRWLANDAREFVRVVQQWKPTDDLRMEYGLLIRQWFAVKNASVKPAVSEELRAKIMALDDMMNELTQLGIHGNNIAVRVGA
jgi:hypothetical protein